MANDRLIFEIVAEGKGIKVVQKDTDALAKSVERTNTARDKGLKGGDKYHKQQKGIYQTGLSSAKGFSKMQQAIGGGSSGLVGAYATLAANVFAATAAFGALRSAAQVEQLAAGLEFVGVQGGRHLTAIADNLREITGLAISSEEAMRSVAIGTSAGFSSGQMEELTQVARGASLALGRDMGDAMNRLVRGAAKLEPEILDELGIMVRLDDATQRYADTLGVSVDSLSQYERRMAFINAINEQGIKNFGDLANSVDPNAYDVLSASLQDLYKNFVNLLNTGLAPLANFIAGSVPMMLGGVALFGATISRTLAPSLYNAASGAAAAAESVRELAANKLRDLKITKGFPKGYKAFNDSVIAGTVSLEEMEEQQKKLTRSITTHQRHVDKYTGAIPTPEGDKERTGISGEADLQKKNDLIREQTAAWTANAEAMDGGAKAQIKNAEAAGYSKAQFGSLKEGWADITNAQVLQREETDRNAKTQTKGQARLASFGTTMGNVGKRAKFMGTALLNSIPAIGMIIMIVGLVVEALQKYVFTSSAFDQAAEKSGEAATHITKTFAKLQETTMMLDNQIDKTAARWKAYAGAVATANDAVQALGKAQLAEGHTIRGETAGQIAHLNQVRNALLKAKEAQQSWSTVDIDNDWSNGIDEFWGSLTELDTRIELNEAKLRKLQKTFDDTGKSMNVVENAGKMAYTIRQQADALAQFGKMSTVEILKMEKLAADVAAGRITDNKLIRATMTEITASSQKTQSAIDSMRGSNEKWIESSNKLSNKQMTPYDDIIENLEAMQGHFDKVKERGKEVYEATKESLVGDPAAEGEAIRAQQEEEKKLNDLLWSRIDLKKVGLSNDEDGMTKYLKRMQEIRGALIKNKAEVKLLSAAHKEVSVIAKGVPEFLQKQLDLEDEIVLKKLEGLQNKLEADKKTLPATQDEAEWKQSILATEIEIAALQATRVSEAVKGLKVDIAREKHNLKMLQIQQAIANAATATFKAKDSQLRAEMELAALQRRSGSRELSPRETFQLDIKAAQTALNTAKIQHSMKIRQQKIDFAIITMETKLLQQQTNERLAKERAVGQSLMDTSYGDMSKYMEGKSIVDALEAEQAGTDSFFQNIFNLVTEKRDALKVLADQELNLAISVQKTSFAKAGEAFKSSVVGAMSGETTIAGVSNAYWKAMRSNKEQQAILRKDAVEQAEKTFKLENAGLHPVALEQGAITAGSNAGTEFDTEMAAGGAFDMGEKLQMMQAQLAPIQEMMKTLGPEGELAAALQEGMFASSAAVLDFADTLSTSGSKMEKVASGLSAASALTAQIGSIMAASSKMKIAAIDKEIERTKKLYGGTKKGEQMVAALEKKKEAQKKKAFEQNKKIMMAQAVMAGAMAIMNVWADQGNGNAWIRAALTAMVVGITAAQIGIISSTSYQGSGGGGGSTPAKVSVGSRSNKVDVAGSKSGGELSYMRGERGIGSSASDFSRRGAFTGRYHRATGGAAYVVGEQGPELFVPEVPGQIVANDEIEEGGVMPNVTFNINAIDASNMEETLVSQRGNIINMIREAANNQGETFLEGLDTLALGDS